MKLAHRIFTLAAGLCAITHADAAEKNGLMAIVGKKTIERGDSGSGYYSKSDRTQGLALDVKNMSIKDFPEGDVHWTIVVRRSYEGGSDKFTGKEKLKALKPAQQHQLVLGAAQVTGYKTDYRNYKDKLEYEVVISHDGKETIRLSSTPGFAALAKNATSRDRGEGEGEGERPRRGEGEGDAPKKEGGDKPAIAKGGGDKAMPKKEGGDAPVPAKPEANPPPNTGGEKPMPPKGDGDTPPKADGEKPFDFFNLDKKKKSERAAQ
jgi:hypothetical protein